MICKLVGSEMPVLQIQVTLTRYGSVRTQNAPLAEGLVKPGGEAELPSAYDSGVSWS